MNRAGIRLVTVVQLMSQTGYEWPILQEQKKVNKGQGLSG